MGEILALNVNLDEVTDREIPSKIDINEVMPEAIEILNQYYDKHVTVISKDFFEDRWVFKHHLSTDPQVFNFDFVKGIVKFSKKADVDEFINILKCWIAFKLNDKGIESVRISFFDVLSAIYASSCFKEDMVTSFISKLEQYKIYRLKRQKKVFTEVEVSDASIEIYCRNVIDFLDFYDPVKFKEYIDEISLVKSKTKVSIQSRELPSYADILKFKKYIDDWAEDIENKDGKEYLRFFPVYIWWELTTIIPMRPSELCLIKRDCLSKKGYYITFPRLKRHRKGENRLKDLNDTLPIPKFLYERIARYINISNNGSEYLFDFSTIVEAVREVEVDYEEDAIFTILHLSELIGKFYKQVIHDQYKVSIRYVKGQYKNMFFSNRENEFESFICLGNDSIDEMLRPGDLRHIAILNLFLQGYDPVEIERLAGHLHEETQLGYQRHMQFWVDSQIQQLAIDFTNFNINLNNIDFKVTIHPKAIEKYKKIYKRKMFIENELLEISEDQKLEIGFCQDESMPCPTFNWRHSGCYFCKHWGISESELNLKREKIIKDMSLVYDELRDKVNFMKSLLLIQFDDIGKFNKDAKKSLSITSNEVQEGIANVAKMMSMLGVE